MNHNGLSVLISVSLSGLLLIACQPTQRTVSFATSTLGVTPKITSTLETVDAPTQFATATPTPIAAKRHTSTPKPTRTFTLLPPTNTSSPVPTLTTHQWNPEAVLVQYDARGGDGCCDYPLPPRFILYADGQLFISQFSKQLKSGQYDWRTQLMTRRLTRTEICALLNTIDQLGFFDYDPTTYGITADNANIDGAGDWYITVNAWRSKGIALYALGPFIELMEDYSEPQGTPIILPALRNTYMLVAHYPSERLQVYQPDRLGVWVSTPTKTKTNATWPLQSPTLAELYEQSGGEGDYPGKSIVLKDTAAKAVYDLFEQSFSEFGMLITEGEYSYPVFARPLLPYEAPSERGESYSPIPAPEYARPSFTLSCQPSDGLAILPVP